MFHLLVSYSGWGTDRDSIGRDRLFEYTEDGLGAQFLADGKLVSTKVSKVPALFLSESGGTGSQFARVGTITRARISGRDVNLEYQFDDRISPIQNKDLEQIAGELDITDFEFSRTHWAIKDVDLFRALVRIRSSQKISPKVFKLNESGAVDSNLISAMMPFHPSFDKVYDALKDMAKGARMKCIRADDIWESDVVVQDIASLIERSRLVICDCSGKNPNVFYELGIAHSLGKDVILIAQSKGDVPFDIQHIRFVRYLNNTEGRAELVKKILSRIDTLRI